MAISIVLRSRDSKILIFNKAFIKKIRKKPIFSPSFLKEMQFFWLDFYDTCHINKKTAKVLLETFLLKNIRKIMQSAKIVKIRINTINAFLNTLTFSNQAQGDRF